MKSNIAEKKMLVRLSFTDFDGVNFMNDVKKNKTIYSK